VDGGAGTGINAESPNGSGRYPVGLHDLLSIWKLSMPHTAVPSLP
jgi:hypothetical protein